jgi:hypothetical protein
MKAHNRLLARFEGPARLLEIQPEVSHILASQTRCAELAGSLDTSIEWLISAAALVWMVLGILGF